MVSVTLLQSSVAMPFVFCCSVQPAEGEGQETATVFVIVIQMFSDGAAVGMLKRYATSASAVPISTRPLPTAATGTPKWSPIAGAGFVIVVSNVPFVLNRYAAPAS